MTRQEWREAIDRAREATTNAFLALQRAIGTVRPYSLPYYRDSGADSMVPFRAEPYHRAWLAASARQEDLERRYRQWKGPRQ